MVQKQWCKATEPKVGRAAIKAALLCLFTCASDNLSWTNHEPSTIVCCNQLYCSIYMKEASKDIDVEKENEGACVGNWVV
eukprot:scaffold175_cov177-Amphora_coffeaeformis.AAC.22